jgi:hypothetical protein
MIYNYLNNYFTEPSYSSTLEDYLDTGIDYLFESKNKPKIVAGIISSFISGVFITALSLVETIVRLALTFFTSPLLLLKDYSTIHENLDISAGKSFHTSSNVSSRFIMNIQIGFGALFNK